MLVGVRGRWKSASNTPVWGRGAGRCGTKRGRRHRPRTFDSVVGQEHIVRTLRNAIELDKVHHAWVALDDEPSRW
jgi:hypothetical protein